MRNAFYACCGVFFHLSHSLVALSFPLAPIDQPIAALNPLQWYFDTVNDPWKKNGKVSFSFCPDLSFLPKEDNNAENLIFIQSSLEQNAKYALAELAGSVDWGSRVQFSFSPVANCLPVKLFPELEETKASPQGLLFQQYLSRAPQVFYQKKYSQDQLGVALHYSKDPQVLDRDLRVAIKIGLSVFLNVVSRESNFLSARQSPMFDRNELLQIGYSEKSSNWVSTLSSSGYDLSLVDAKVNWRSLVQIPLSTKPVIDSDTTLVWEGIDRLVQQPTVSLKASAFEEFNSQVSFLTGNENTYEKAICGEVLNITKSSPVLFKFRDHRFSDDLTVDLRFEGPNAFSYETQMVRFFEFTKTSPSCKDKVIKVCVWSSWLPQYRKPILENPFAPKTLAIEPIAIAPLKFERNTCTQVPDGGHSKSSFLYL